MIAKLTALSTAALLAAPASVIMLKASPSASEAKLRATVSVLRERLARLGARASVTRGPGSAVIEIMATGLADPARAARILSAPGRLEMYDLEADLAAPSIRPDGFPIAHTRRLPVRTGTVLVTCGPREVVCPGVGLAPSRTYYYLFKGNPALTNADLRLSSARLDFDPLTNEPVVLFQFTASGRKKFHEVTRVEAVRGKRRGFLQHFAIVLDGELRSFPSIDYSQYPDGIDPSNGVEITGIRSLAEAKGIAVLLGTPPLPVRLLVVRTSRL